MAGCFLFTCRDDNQPGSAKQISIDVLRSFQSISTSPLFFISIFRSSTSRVVVDYQKGAVVVCF